MMPCGLSRILIRAALGNGFVRLASHWQRCNLLFAFSFKTVKSNESFGAAYS